LYKEDTASSRRLKKEGKRRPLWQVVCYTREDWEGITQQFADSKSNSERALHVTLKEDFLPEIPRLFEEKEKLQMKRLAELSPRRTSSRGRKSKKEEDQMKSAGKKLSKEEEEKELQKFREDQKKWREDRLRRYSHGSDQEDEDDEYSPPPRSPSPLPPPPSHSSSLSSGLKKVLKYLLKKEEVSWPFTEPIDRKLAPDYYERIRQPMDLTKMGDKLEKGRYADVAEFESDFRLIIVNCRKYNGPGSGEC
jgi:hypothetical protein